MDMMEPLGLTILGGHLAVLDQTADHLVGGHKAALAVGDGDGVEVAHMGLEHPGGLDRGHPGGDVPALVAADQVVGQSGALIVHGADLPVWDQPQLDEGLEAVADAQHQAVPVPKQVMDRIGQPGLRRKEAMNFPEPSGSSPPEKPPGRTTIWLRRMASSRA